MEDIIIFIKEYKNILIPVTMFLVMGFFGILALYNTTKNTIIREFKKSRKKSMNSIRECEYVKVIGKAKAINDPLLAPLSGRLCVYYHVLVEVKGDKSWRKIINDEKYQDFYIESQSEIAKVELTTLHKSMKRYYLVKDYKHNSGFRNDAPKQLEAYLELHSKKSTGLFGINKTIRYTEGVIEINETIGVKGIANRVTLKEPIVGYSYSKILTLTGTKKEKLLVTDEPKALLRVENRL